MRHLDAGRMPVPEGRRDVVQRGCPEGWRRIGAPEELDRAFPGKRRSAQGGFAPIPREMSAPDLRDRLTSYLPFAVVAVVGQLERGLATRAH